MVLDTSLVSTQQYKVCFKGKVEQSRERSSTLPYSVVAIEKKAFWSPSTTVANNLHLIKENSFILTKTKSRRYPTETITDVDYADYLALLVNTPIQAESLLHNLEQAAGGISFYVNANKTELMCFK